MRETDIVSPVGRGYVDGLPVTPGHCQAHASFEPDRAGVEEPVVTVNPLADAIMASIAKSLDQGVIQRMVDDRIQKAVRDAIDSSMSFGGARRAMTNKIDELLVPAIEGYDLSRCNVKLELLLDELVEESAIAERRDMLRKFKILMSTDGVPEVINASDIAVEWEQWVSREFDCDDRDYEDGEYEFIEARQSVRYSSSYTGLFEHASLTFEVTDVQNIDSDEFGITIPLTRHKDDETWRIDARHVAHLDISRLRRLSSFATYLYRLELAGTRVVIDISDDELSIQPDSQPGE